jgi:AcrR family transcriptional regulator
MSDHLAIESDPTGTRGTILSAAIKQIAANGYQAVRLRDIAKAAGVSIGLLQHHFGTRDELVGEAFGYHCAALLREWETLARDRVDDPWDRLLGLVDRLARSQLLAERATIWADFCASAARHPELQPHLRRVENEWRSVLAGAIRDGTARGEFRPQLPTDDVADLLVAQIDGALLAIAGEMGHMDGDRLHDLMVASAALLLDYSPDEQS